VRRSDIGLIVHFVINSTNHRAAIVTDLGANGTADLLVFADDTATVPTSSVPTKVSAVEMLKWHLSIKHSESEEPNTWHLREECKG
jgi:hypothetical protein